MDFVFLDGNHAPPQVVKDLIAWWPKVKVGGVYCGHDYGGYGDRHGRYGVKKGVNAFALEHGLGVQVREGNVWFVLKT